MMNSDIAEKIKKLSSVGGRLNESEIKKVEKKMREMGIEKKGYNIPSREEIERSHSKINMTATLKWI